MSHETDFIWPVMGTSLFWIRNTFFSIAFDILKTWKPQDSDILWHLNNFDALSIIVILIPNKRTWLNICLNCSSIGAKSAEMTGSLCRHTAAINVHGESALSVTAWVCNVARQKDVLKNWRHCLCLTAVLLKEDTNVKKDRLANFPQGAAIFCYCVQCTPVKKRNSVCDQWQRGWWL